MKLPIIRSMTEFIEKNDKDSVEKAIAALEHISQARGVKEEELNYIGELISNMAGALEVQNMIDEGKPQKDALNEFMQRVTGSIDK